MSLPSFGAKDAGWRRPRPSKGHRMGLGPTGLPALQAMCRNHASTTFLWSHNGKTKSGWIQLLPGGKLSTTWCLGTWEVLANNPDVVDMCFGTSRHLCHYKDGGFIVEQKYALRTGKESYKPGVPKSCGFITHGDERGHRGVPGERGYKNLGQGKRKDLSDDEAEARSMSFLQKDMDFNAFFGAWSDWQSKRARCMAAIPWAKPEPAEVAEVPPLPEEPAFEVDLRQAEEAADEAEMAAEAARLASAEAAAARTAVEAQ
ncbi:unnamed protein product [Effrenium voratum]|nr:unnamed protein product [Effrenium voratum]